MKQGEENKQGVVLSLRKRKRHAGGYFTERTRLYCTRTGVDIKKEQAACAVPNSKERGNEKDKAWGGR